MAEYGPCGKCRAWCPVASGLLGYCRRHPPARDGRGDPLPAQPLTREDDGCWDFLGPTTGYPIGVKTETEDDRGD